MLKHHFNLPSTSVVLFSGFWAFQLFITKVAFLKGAMLGSFVFLSALSTLLVCSIYFLPKTFPELSKLWNINRKALMLILCAGWVHYGLGGMFSTAGIAFTSATNAAFLSKLSFVFTVGLAALFLSESFTVVKLIASSLMLCGSYLLATHGLGLSAGVGNLLVIIACICWSSSTILVKLALKKTMISGELISAIRPFVGTPFLLTYSVLVPRLAPATQTIFGVTVWDPDILPYALVNGLLIVLTWVFLNRTLTMATASYMTMMSMMTPVIVAILSISFLNENLIKIQLVGAGLIILGAVITHLYERKNRTLTLVT